MPIRHRSALAAALWLLAAAVPAAADEIMMPREPQIGPGRFIWSTR
jgi:glycerophosphoryl diester phosphodiesterase